MSSRIVPLGSSIVEAVPWRRVEDPASQAPSNHLHHQPQNEPATSHQGVEEQAPQFDPCEPLRATIAGLEKQLAVNLRAADEREKRALDQGRLEGHATGLREGAASVQAEAKAAIDAVKAEAADRAAQAAGQAVDLRKRLRQQMEADLVKLAIAVARRILRRELAVDPDALLGIVKSAVERIAARELLAIRVAPCDASRVRARLADYRLPERVEVLEDAALAWGSVILDTSRGHHDASVETQIEEIDRGLADLVGRPA